MKVEPLLNIDDLRVYFHSTRGEYKVVDGVNLQVSRREILGIAGESGCGKSTVVEAIMRLIRPPGYVKSGTITFSPPGSGQPIDLLKLAEEPLRKMRWRSISYIPQGSMNALNPVMRLEAQMLDVMLEHSDYTKTAARSRAAEVLALVGLPPQTLQAYPHELSGGMKQRAIIAIAMTLQPQLVVADEPTTALDVNVQRAVLEAVKNIKEQTGATVIFVSHDLAVHAEVVDRLAVMYAGRIVESDTVKRIFKKPLHPYSQRLLASIPRLGGPRVRQEAVLGQAPDRLNWPSGCRFHPRCPVAMDVCRQVEPPLLEVEAGHRVACHLYYEYDGQRTPQVPLVAEVHRAR